MDPRVVHSTVVGDGKSSRPGVQTMDHFCPAEVVRVADNLIPFSRVRSPTDMMMLSGFLPDVVVERPRPGMKLLRAGRIGSSTSFSRRPKNQPCGGLRGFVLHI